MVSEKRRGSASAATPRVPAPNNLPPPQPPAQPVEDDDDGDDCNDVYSIYDCIK